MSNADRDRHVRLSRTLDTARAHLDACRSARVPMSQLSDERTDDDAERRKRVVLAARAWSDVLAAQALVASLEKALESA